MMTKQIKSVIETLLFLEGDPVSPSKVTQIFDISFEDAKKLFLELKKEYEDDKRGIRIREIKGAFQFASAKENYDYVKAIVFPEKERMLSPAALEVLTIITYKQPITKPGIDGIRGIKSERIVYGLIEKGLVEEAGKSDAPGKPMQYKTTNLFLEKLNISSLKDLPPFNEDDDELLESPEKSSDNQIELDL